MDPVSAIANLLSTSFSLFTNKADNKTASQQSEDATTRTFLTSIYSDNAANAASSANVERTKRTIIIATVILFAVYLGSIIYIKTRK